MTTMLQVSVSSGSSKGSRRRYCGGFSRATGPELWGLLPSAALARGCRSMTLFETTEWGGGGMHGWDELSWVGLGWARWGGLGVLDRMCWTGCGAAHTCISTSTISGPGFEQLQEQLSLPVGDPCRRPQAVTWGDAPSASNAARMDACLSPLAQSISAKHRPSPSPKWPHVAYRSPPPSP
jgi:hypothetical protein